MLRPAPSEANASGLASPSVRRGFVQLDDLLITADACGVHAVRVADPSLAGAVASHVARRANERGRAIAAVTTDAIASFWREVALRAGIADLPADVDAAADAIARWAGASRAVIVGPLAGGSHWDSAVATAIAQLAPAGALVLVVSSTFDPSGGAFGAAEESRATFVIDDVMDDAALARWWSAIAAEGRARSRGEKLAHLDGWWRRRGVAIERNEPEAIVVDQADRTLFARLALVARPWPIARLGAFDAIGNVARLQATGAIESSGSLVCASTFDVAASAEDRIAAARALEKTFPTDPWAHARAAELLAAADDVSGAEIAHVRAIACADDVVARSDLWSRWAAAVDAFPEPARHGCRLRAAELALARADADGATLWAERALSSANDDFAALLVLGRAALSRGDLVAADVTLRRALAAAPQSTDRGRALAELAEVRYAQGKLDEAESLAKEALGLAASSSARLGASNTLGKLLLARGAWVQAEEHFTHDASIASASGDTTAHLRARLNRAIAVLSDGRADEAKPMLEAVLVEGEHRGDARAVAFALSNLAVLAINRHEYGEALVLSERAIGVRRKLGERLGLARVIGNLAELRLRLGLIDEAEQALSFGRLTLSRGTTFPRTAHFALVAARIQLARGDTIAARREVTAALSGAPSSSDGDMLSECHRLEARIALEDGDVERASRDIDLAALHSTTPSAHAEVALLRAMLARAEGVPAIDLALAAITQARRASDEELLLEAHILAATVAEDDRETIRRNLSQAATLRDHVVASLSERLRSAYLARPELVRLARLERDADAPESAASPHPAAKPAGRVAVVPPSRAIVGEDPAIRSLLDGIRKVARSDATVLVFGESGTGKELVAEALHEASTRRDAPLVKVNCGALVESLLLSELFGHEKGSFTGALARKRGRFEMAEGGTLFLDEIGDISPGTQVALLRVLQERTFERVGGTTPIRANVRVVCATHRDLRAMVERGEFRQDLYFRLTGIVLHVPALRARAGDLPLLARALLERIAAERGEPVKTLSSDALSVLARHRWPGNIRELENALRAAAVFVDGPVVRAADLVEHVEGLRGLAAPSAPAPRASGEVPIDASSADPTDIVYAALKAGRFGLFDVKKQLERDCIARALTETKGNITRAAALLGMKRPRLSQLVKQYGLAAGSTEGT